jgi:polysaccharide export outer membrane protein
MEGTVTVELRIGLMALGLLLLVPARPSLAMELSPEMKKMIMGDAEAKSKASQARFPSGSEGPDNSIDPEHYIVGGGDGFQISIIGLPSQEYFPVVNADGNIYDGDLGLIVIGKVPLKRALILIQEKVQRNLKKRYELYVALVKTKTANVSVTGTVANPGSVRVSGVSRILDAIKMANGGLLPPLEQSDYRHVTVRSGDSTVSYDLLRFFSKQDLRENPYVYPGDIVRLDRMDSRVYVAGEIMDPVTGWVPLKQGETLGDLLGILNLKQTADSGRILVQQASAPSRQRLKQLSWNEAQSLPLAPNDVVSIPPLETGMRPDTVMVTGEVKQPGTYPVRPGANTVTELMKIAGGPTEQGNMERAVIIRHRKMQMVMVFPGQIEKPGAYANGGAKAATLQSVRPEISSSINDLRTSGDYILLQVAGMEEKPILEDGDEVYVPRHDNLVYVSGNVKKPGAYPYVQGKGYGYYVDQAHGYTNKADRKNQFVLSSYRGFTQIRDLENLGEGDVLVVPAAIEYKRFSTVYLPIVQMVPAILSLVITYMLYERTTR